MENTEQALARELIDFIDRSPTSYHAVKNVRSALINDGFTPLEQENAWNLEKGGKYVVTQNGSALFAFEIGHGEHAEEGISLICAHGDSPTFRVKPSPEIAIEGKYLKLNTEVYGGPILYTWFDRPLSLAGRVLTSTSDTLHPGSRLVYLDRPLLVIPHIAIHFNRAVNEQGNPLSKQKDMLPVLGMINERLEHDHYLSRLLAGQLGVPETAILDFDLTLHEHAKGTLCGLHEEFISCGRLDDLAMVHAGLKALLGTSGPSRRTRVLAIFDNEEVGSGTKQGAASPVLRTILERIIFGTGGSPEDLYRAIHRSFMISADMAHALHPNYPEKHDPTNHPVINGGPVIKFNANQKYVTDGESAAIFDSICQLAGVPCQRFVNHSDMAGGSTLGNLLLSQMETRGVDIGNPMWGMHSARETAGVKDHAYMIKALTTFYDLN